MKLSSILLISALGAFSTGVLSAQAPQARLRQRGAAARLLDPATAERRLTRMLGLNAEQQNKVHAALEERQVLSKGLADKASGLRTELGAAVRAADDAKIDQVTRDLAQLNQQRSAIQAKTLAKIYGALDAGQKARIDGALNRELGVPLARARARRAGAPRGRLQ
jgi:hypothetical protein